MVTHHHMTMFTADEVERIHRKFHYWMGHRQGHCIAFTPEGDTCDRPSVHDGLHKDAGTGRTWATDSVSA